MSDTYLIRSGELGVKGDNRTEFERKLQHNVQLALARVGRFKVVREFGRIYALAQDASDRERTLAELTTVFGISSVSPATAVALDEGAMAAAAVDCLVREMAGIPAPERPVTFKVDTRRVNKAYPMGSTEVSRRLGAHLLETVPGLKVDVHHPRLTVGVEIRQEQAWVYARVVPGAGGMPVGTAGRVALLLSGGIDSPVAGWLSIKRGPRLDAVFVHAPPFTSERAKEKVLSLARVLSRWHLAPIRVHAVPFTPIQEAIVQATDERLRVVLYRRFMGRIAQEIARKIGALALVTGESLAQVASQTLENLAVIDAAVQMPILRPLIGFDKLEITRLAERIGTYEYSILPFDDCCSLFLPRHPKTRCRPDEVEDAESRLDVGSLVARAVAATEVHTVSWDERHAVASVDAPETDELAERGSLSGDQP